MRDFTNGSFYLFVGAIVTFSGFCSLVYQVVWDRTLRYNFGGDSVSSAIVTATFLLGLGIGAFIFGKWRRQAIVTYALVEMGIGAYAVVSYYILAPLAVGLGTVFSYSITDIEGLRAIVIIACILFLLLPCILMGGTLPLIFNCFVHPGVYKNRMVGMLYGLNTAGASLGVLAVPLLFLNRISIPSTLLIVGGGNILLGAGVFLFRNKLLLPQSIVDVAPQITARNRTDQLPVSPLLALSFISGFIVLSFEISLLRTVGLLTQMSPYTFSLVLMPFLLALALGSMVSTRFKEYSTEQALGRVGVLFIFATGAMLAGILTRYYYAANILLLIIPVPLLLGGTFPLLLRLASSTGKELPRRTGIIYLSNSVGAFLGAMFTQFYGFANLGTQSLITFLCLVGLGTGAVCLIWVVSKTETAALVKYSIIFAAAVLAFVPLLIPAPLWNVYTFNTAGLNIDRIEGPSGVAVIDWQAHYPLGDVIVNGTYMSALPDHPKHIQLGSMALSMPHRENVLVLGLGGGGMIRELVADPEIKHIDVIDWSYELPLVLESSRARASLKDALQNSKVRVFRADARVAVSLYEDDSFDLIIDNLAILGWAGSTSIKSVTYFSEISRILKPSGEFVFYPNYLWIPDREAILAGLLENFQYVQEHQTSMILASSLPVDIDPDRVEAVLENRGKALGLAQPYADWLMSGFKSVTAGDTNGALPIFDQLLIYEYRFFGKLRNAPPAYSNH